jgi:hypothetical protein
MTPVTIGDQKFIKDFNKGWIDSKTKQPADKGLIRLLDSLVIDEPVLKKLRTKIDKRVEPVSISGQKFVYDVNQGWVDEKTKTPVPPSLQRTLSNSVPRFGNNSDIDLTAGFGMAGTAGLQQTKAKAKPKSGGGTLINTHNTNINKPLVAMINQLASIDGFLKQRIDNQKIIAKNNLLAIRESQVEAVDQEPQVEVIKPDAEKVKCSSAGLLALGGLVLLTLDPVQEAIKSVIDGVVNAGKFITDVVSSINDGFTFLFSSNATDPTAVDSTPESKPSAPVASTPDAQPVTTVAPSATTSTASAIPSAATSIAIPSITGSSKPSFSSAPVATGGAATPVSTGSSSSSTSMPVATGGSTTPVSSSTPMAPSSPQSKPAAFGSAEYFTANAGNTGNIIQVNHSETGSGWGIAGANNARGIPIAFSKEGAIAFAKMMQDSNGIVKPSDIESSKRTVAYQEQMKKRGLKPAANSPHLRGVAMDIHGASSAWIRQHGHKYGWNPHDYSGTHGGHFVFGGAGAIPDEGSSSVAGSMTQAVAQAASSGLNKIGELLGIIGSAIIKPGVPRDDIPNTIAIAAREMNADIAVSKTPKPLKVPLPPSPPKINRNSSGPTQNPATAEDKNSVYYYLRRFGYQELSTPESTLKYV